MTLSHSHPIDARAGEGSAAGPEPSASAAEPPLAFEAALAEIEAIVARWRRASCRSSNR